MSSFEDAEDRPEPPSRPRSIAGWILGVIVVAWAALMILFGSRMNPNKLDLAPPPMTTAPVDYDWSLKDLDGRTVPFAEFKGKTVFLNFWATWCGPCISEMPSIDALAEDESLKEVVFLGVSVDEDEDEVKRFVGIHSPKFRVLRPAGRVPAQLITDGIPATFVIGPDGKIALSHVGAERWDSPDVVAFLQRISRGSPPE